MFGRTSDSIRRVVSNNFFIIGIVWKISKLRFIIKVFITIASSILPVIKIIIVKNIISILENNGVMRTTVLLNQVLISIIGYTIVQFAIKVFFDFNNVLLEPFLATKVNKEINNVFFEKAKQFEYRNFEDPNFYDKYTRALAQSENISHAVFNSFFQFVGSIVSVLSLSILILSMDWKVVLFGSFIVVLNFVQSLIGGRLNFNTSQSLTPVSRRQNYIKTILYNPMFAKEIQSGDVINTGKRYYDEALKKLLDILKKYGKKILLLNIFFSILTTTSATGMMIYLILQVWNDIYSISDYATLMSSSGQFESTLGVLFDNISNFYKNSLEIDNLKEIYSYERSVADGTLALDEKKAYTIEAKNLYFKYPNSKKYALKNISFKIQAGEKVAIIGFNGSGKSTLIKLLTGLYNTEKGKILINGFNITEFKREELQSKIGVIFQDYQIFAFNIKENISYEQDLNEKTKDVIKNLELDHLINSLPSGLYTSLSKEFDTIGTNISGGEAQKICIARALDKPAGLVILDEPSSALDLVSENNLNKILLEEVNKTIIFTSHRMSIVSMADNIILLNKGEIEEQGSHEELMEKRGLYYELFSKQNKG